MGVFTIIYATILTYSQLNSSPFIFIEQIHEKISSRGILQDLRINLRIEKHNQFSLIIQNTQN